MRLLVRSNAVVRNNSNEAKVVMSSSVGTTSRSNHIRKQCCYPYYHYSNKNYFTTTRSNNTNTNTKHNNVCGFRRVSSTTKMLTMNNNTAFLHGTTIIRSSLSSLSTSSSSSLPLLYASKHSFTTTTTSAESTTIAVNTSTTATAGAAVDSADDEPKTTTTTTNNTMPTKNRRGERTRAAQMIPLWLKKEPEYFERTMEALMKQTTTTPTNNDDDNADNDNDDNDDDNDNDSANERQYHYNPSKKQKRQQFEEMLRNLEHRKDLKNNMNRIDDFNITENTTNMDDDNESNNNNNNQYYQEWKYTREFSNSIIHFLDDFVLNNISNNTNENYNHHTTIIQNILDDLIRLGFGDESFARQYQNFNLWNTQMKQNDRLIRSTEKQVTKKKSLLHRLYAEYQNIPKHDKRGQKQHQILIQQHEQAGNKLLRNISRLEREQKKLHSRMNPNTTAEQQSQQTQQQTQQQPQQERLTPETFQQINHQVKDLLLNQHNFCDVLAEYIKHSHEKKLKQYQDLDAKTDLTKPQEWYLRARLMRRKIIYHGGPTNSGKTYTALKRLKEAKNGLYLGPLRLLAAEVYDTLTSEGVYTNLITGQEKREIAFATHSAATVEMFGPMSNDAEKEFDVCVIDEIQLIQDSDRGFAWTRALLGLQCKEIHVCGGLEARTVVEKLAKSCGDEFELHTYERFNTLEALPRSLATHPGEKKCYRHVRPGDCIVAFSRNDIFAIKREIEKLTKHRVCVIYGSLPPSTRKQQAQMFNDPESGYDILVASDAIGMGLNLNIRRIIFNSIFKYDGHSIIRLDHSSMKQISGRAGRYASLYSSGEVTTRDPRDLKYLHDCLKTEIEPIRKAGLIPTAAHIQLFHEALMDNNNNNTQQQQEMPLHNIIHQFSEIAVLKGDYFLCRLTDIFVISKWLEHISMSLEDKFTFTMAPVITNSDGAKDLLVRFATKYAAGEVPGLGRGSTPKRATDFKGLTSLCSVYSELEMFLWLQHKFPPINFMEQQSALGRLEMTTAFISIALNETNRLKLDHCYLKQDNRLRSVWEENNRKQIEDYEEDEEDDDQEYDGHDEEVAAAVGAR